MSLDLRLAIKNKGILEVLDYIYIFSFISGARA